VSHGRRTIRRARRARGFALIDVIVGGVILGIGLSVLLSVSARSMALQRAGERRLVASWLADELLCRVLVDGPEDFPLRNDVAGWFDAPFEDYSYEVTIEDEGRGLPYRVIAGVRWDNGPGDFLEVETRIAVRGGDPDQPREPLERIDREERWYDDEEE